MGKIDTSEWKEFRIKDLFETQKKGNKLQVPTGASVPVQDLLEDGATPRITVTGSNNGIFGFYDYCGKNIADYRVFNNFVSVSFLGTVFYQEGDATLDMKVHCLKPNGITLNKYTGRFLVGAIRASLRESTYSDQISSSILPEMSIKLPSTPNGAPDWTYMESYMASLETKVAESLTMLQAAKDAEKKKVDTREWGEFRVGELFDAFLSKDDIQPKSITEGATPLVSSGKENNGIIAYIEEPKAHLWEGNTLTVDMFGKVFFHEQPYFAVSHGRVNILKAKSTVSSGALQFVGCAIEKVTSKKYEFSEMCTGTKLLRDTIMLPVDKNGDPDWNYMEEYMKMVQRKTENVLNQFVSSKKDCENKHSINDRRYNMSPLSIFFYIVMLIITVCVIAGIDYLRIYLKSPFEYPYFIRKFDVTGKRNIDIEDYIDTYLIENRFDEIQNYYNMIQQ